MKIKALIASTVLLLIAPTLNSAEFYSSFSSEDCVEKEGGVSSSPFTCFANNGGRIFITNPDEKLDSPILTFYINPRNLPSVGWQTPEKVEEAFDEAQNYWSNISGSQAIVLYGGFTKLGCDQDQLGKLVGIIVFCFAEKETITEVCGGPIAGCIVRKGEDLEEEIWLAFPDPDFYTTPELVKDAYAYRIANQIGYLFGLWNPPSNWEPSIMGGTGPYAWKEIKENPLPYDVDAMRYLYTEPLWISSQNNVVEIECVQYGPKNKTYTASLELISDENENPLVLRLLDARKRTTPAVEEKCSRFNGLDLNLDIEFEGGVIVEVETTLTSSGQLVINSFTLMRFDRVNLDGFAFPLKGSPYDARISAVFDHSNGNGCADDKVIAYTGEKAFAEDGLSIFSTALQSDFCEEKSKRLYGFRNENGEKFIINGQYDHSMANELGYYLFYDGHTGYDYPADEYVLIYPIEDGVIVKSECTNISCTGYGEIAIEHSNGYTSHYLHLNRAKVDYAVGDTVKKQHFIGFVGDTGVEPGNFHLHLTIKKDLVRVDPYGWEGSKGGDPVQVNNEDNKCLWRRCPK